MKKILILLLLVILCVVFAEEAIRTWKSKPHQPSSTPTVPSSGGHTAGERMVKTVNGVEYAFHWCPAGTFMMGSPTSETGQDDNETQHSVTLTKGFWMLETEVTQGMWESVMGTTIEEQAKKGTYGHSLAGTGANNPMYYVSWDDCQEFCQKLRTQGLNVQLPTEAQWEYACRAGTTGEYAGYRLDSMGWYDGNSDSTTHAVGQKSPNPWGLYDMHGNVLEWCTDWYDSGYYSGLPTTDPTGPSSGTHRVLRGGSWGGRAKFCHSVLRAGSSPASRSYYLGFRIVLFVP